MIVTGNLKDFGLTDIIKMSCVDIQTCQIIIKTNSGEGVIYFSNGMPVHAQLGNTMGEEAIYGLLNETEKFGGVFRVEPDIVLPKRTITMTWESLIDKNDQPEELLATRVPTPVPVEKNRYQGQREAISKVLQNFQSQSQAPTQAVVQQNTEVSIKPIDQSAVKSITPSPVVLQSATPEPKKTPGRGEVLRNILRTLIRREADVIEGVAVVSTEGFIIASALPEELEDEHVAAISAVVLSMGERITRELQRGTMEQVYVRGKMGYVFLSQAGPDALLTVITNPNAKLGMVFLDTKRTIKELVPLL